MKRHLALRNHSQWKGTTYQGSHPKFGVFCMCVSCPTFVFFYVSLCNKQPPTMTKFQKTSVRRQGLKETPKSTIAKERKRNLQEFLEHCQVSAQCIEKGTFSDCDFYVLNVDEWKKCCKEFELAHPGTLQLLSAPFCSGCGQERTASTAVWLSCFRIPYVAHHWCKKCLGNDASKCLLCSATRKIYNVSELYEKKLAVYDPGCFTLTIGSGKRVIASEQLPLARIVQSPSAATWKLERVGRTVRVDLKTPGTLRLVNCTLQVETCTFAASINGWESFE